MRHHELRLQVELHRELAEDGLREHAGHEAERQPGEVAASGNAHQAAENGDDHRDRHDPGDEPVRVLDEPVLARDREPVELPCRAAEPDRAAEARVGEPDRAAGHDDHREQDRGDERDALVGPGAQVRDPHGEGDAS
jgi:hypothetical protein